jgi:hypothetical protein
MGRCGAVMRAVLLCGCELESEPEEILTWRLPAKER